MEEFYSSTWIGACKVWCGFRWWCSWRLPGTWELERHVDLWSKPDVSDDSGTPEIIL